MKQLLRNSLLLILPLFQLSAQTPINMNPQLDNLFLRVIEVSEREGKAPVAIQGSIFLTDDFVSGEVLTSDAHYENVMVKYNILDDVFYFQIGPNQVRVLDPKSELKMVKANGQVFVVRNYDYKTRNVTGFLEQFVEGKYSLFAKKNITLRPGRPPKALDTEPTPAKYIRPADTFYLGMPDGTLQKINNGKDVVAFFNSSKLVSEAKDQKISLKKEEHLPALIQLVNEMSL